MECMQQVPGAEDGGAVVLVPKAEVDGAAVRAMEQLPMPAVLRNHTVFALTAFDPPGVSRTLAENAAENARLWEDCLSRLSPQPAAAWRTFGVHLKEGWREDGFCLAYPASDAAGVDAARTRVLAAARLFRQGAIFEYGPASVGEVVRQTLPAAAEDGVESTELLVRVRESPPLPGALARPWAGPASFPRQTPIGIAELGTRR